MAAEGARGGAERSLRVRRLTQVRSLSKEGEELIAVAHLVLAAGVEPLIERTAQDQRKLCCELRGLVDRELVTQHLEVCLEYPPGLLAVVLPELVPDPVEPLVGLVNAAL